jgi:hypothetical protein
MTTMQILLCHLDGHVTPGVQENWAAHTASRYYIGNAWEHYRCHEVYISATKGMRICKIVFFQHKYLAMPTITPADALIKAADNLVDAIYGQLPKNNVTADTLEQLMEIYTIQAKKVTCKAQAQRVLREQAQAQRVSDKQQAGPQQASTQHTPTSFPAFEIETRNNKTPITTDRSPIITQGDDSPPAVNTRQHLQIQMLTQELSDNEAKHAL